MKGLFAMKLYAILGTILLTAIPAVCSANIIRTCDNQSDTIQYRTTQTVGRAGIYHCSILKKVDAAENEEFYFRMTILFTKAFSFAVKYLVEPVVDVNIDGVSYKIKKVTDSTQPRTIEILMGGDICYYRLTSECLEALKKANSAVFTAYVPEKEPYVMTLNSTTIAEAKNIIENAHFKDYTKDLDALTANYLNKPVKGK